MNEIIEQEEQIKIENMIYEIRGKQVMLDSDLAKLYQVDTKRINEAVRRNKEKFPERFSWKLSNAELQILWSQFATANISTKSRSTPRVFTEQGVAMLSTILKSKIATEVSIKIMDAFVSMRHYISSNLLSNELVEHKLLEHDKRISLLEETFNGFKEKYNHIFFDGQIYDAYSKIVSIVKESKKELTIIDNYADITILDMISKLNIPVTLITTKNNYLTKIDIEKYNEQYNNLKIIYNTTFHDRYLIIDNKTIYHMGASINHAGSKTFSINKLEDTIVKTSLINKIEDLKRGNI